MKNRSSLQTKRRPASYRHRSSDPIRIGDSPPTQKELAGAFLRLANLDNEILERLGRYETRLWQRTLHTIQTLAVMQGTNGA